MRLSPDGCGMTIKSYAPVARWPYDAPVGKLLCAYPTGEPRTPGYRTCDDPHVVPGRSYCPDHMCWAYSNWRRAKLAWQAANGIELDVYPVWADRPAPVPAPVAKRGHGGGVRK